MIDFDKPLRVVLEHKDTVTVLTHNIRGGFHTRIIVVTNFDKTIDRVFCADEYGNCQGLYSSIKIQNIPEVKKLYQNVWQSNITEIISLGLLFETEKEAEDYSTDILLSINGDTCDHLGILKIKE